MKYLGVAIFLTSILLGNPSAQAGAYHFVWGDEFNYVGLPKDSKWSYETFEPKTLNEELQKYVGGRLENTRVEDGVLKIEARRDGYMGYDYTSGRLTSRGKFSINRGRVEIRAKLPWGRGTWPALFMLPDHDTYGGWPNSGEIDIMEHVGHNMDWVRSSIHCEEYNFKKFWFEHKGEEKNADLFVPGVANAFHTYKLEWTDDHIAVSVDDLPPHFVFANEWKGPASWPFDENFHFILTHAIGGQWGGQKGIDANMFPQSLQIDYIRVFKYRP